MRHIVKIELCQEFDNYVLKHNLREHLDNYINNTGIKKHPWKRINSKTKQKLSNHLYSEQKGLCIYCQQSLRTAFENDFKTEISHIEHIKPKKRQRYPQETFNQKNLTLSCNGFDCSTEIRTREFCGHNKHEKYNQRLFLNPVEQENIESFFEYTFEGDIYPAEELNDFDKSKAEEMIKILDLKNSRLIDMRQSAFSDIITNTDEDIKLLLDENSEILPSFYSMMKQLLQ